MVEPNVKMPSRPEIGDEFPGKLFILSHHWHKNR